MFGFVIFINFIIITTITGIQIINPLFKKNYNGIGQSNNGNQIFEVINEWKYLDFDYPTYQMRQKAIANREFILENNLPLGVDISTDRIFVTTPRWKDGVPASLNYLPIIPKELSPLLKPYPNWEEHGDPYNPDCTKLISVYRTQIDECNRLWLIDSGIINATVSLTQICLPKIIAYDLATNQRVVSYEIPKEQVKEDSLHSNIVIDIRNGDCNSAYAYVTDVWRYGIVIFNLASMTSWRASNYQFYPTPNAADFNILNVNFQWPDGVFGMSLLPFNEYTNDRLLLFHPMASYKEFMISTSILRDENIWSNPTEYNSLIQKSIKIIGNRGINGQSTTSGIDKNLVQFFTLIQLNTIGCWDTNKPYTKYNINIIGNRTDDIDEENLIQFPNDIKIDKEFDQGIWLMTNKLPIFLYSKLNYNEINFRILYANINTTTYGTQCDPNVPANDQLIVDDIDNQC